MAIFGMLDFWAVKPERHHPFILALEAIGFKIADVYASTTLVVRNMRNLPPGIWLMGRC